MALHQELIDQADHLLTGPLGRVSGPTDADIRRAVSNAYYAVFHLLVQESTDLLCPPIPALAARFRRGFDHAEIKKVCTDISKANGRPANMSEPLKSLYRRTIDPAIVAIAEAFCTLQTDRHLADYDTSNAISLGTARTSVGTARSAITGWQALGITDEARIFLTALPMHGKWARS